MLSARARKTSVALVASFALIGLTACGGSDDSEAEDSTSATPTPSPESETPEPETEAPETEETEAPEESEAPAASGDQPAWALPPTEGGEKLTTFEVGDVSIDVFQVGTSKATKTGQFVDPDTNKPIIAEGDEIVFVNYVITNNGDPIDLGSSLVDVSARYDDWPFMQGMDSIVDDALFEEQGVNKPGLAPGAFVDPSIYTFGTGQTYSVAENFHHQKDSPITFDATIVPVDASGDLIHDDRMEGEGKATIK